ncbi:MAG: PCMD domain-containing protein [Bacteroidales bacterium]|nr:PCMD domain-containing protein [Bacteroidales bacterium]
MSIRKYITLLFICALATSCFKNTMDYPVIPANILSLEVEGQKSVSLDNSTRTATVYLEETADMKNLKVKNFEISEEAVMDGSLGSTIDLSSPIKIMMHTYQDYEWTIRAVQDIERYITCSNQVGKAQFNLDTKTAIVYVSDRQPLSKLEITSMKLEAEGSEIVSTTGRISDHFELYDVTEDFNPPMTLDCVLARTFKVVYKGEEIIWNFKALQTAIKVEVTSVAYRCFHANIRGLFDGTGSPELQIKRADDTEWTKVEDAKIAGVGISATVSNLSSGTSYEVRVVNGSDISSVYSFTTENPVQLYNMNFDQWNLEGKTWYPYPKGAIGDQLIWDSANKATSSFTGSATTPDEEFVAKKGEGKKAAKLESSYAVVKFAAGSLFTGQFVKLQGLGAELAWGIPFSSRPKALHGWLSYVPAPISYADEDHKSLLGKNDIGQVEVIITDWDDQFHVLSAEKKYVDTEKDPHIIGFANMEIDYDTEGYIEFTLDIDYRAERAPKYIVIVASSSRYGDFFTGGVGSTLHLDEFEFIYD